MEKNFDIDKLETFVKEGVEIFKQYPLLELYAIKVLNKNYKSEDCITEYFSYESSITKKNTSEYCNKGYNYYANIYNNVDSEILLNDLNEDICKYIKSIMQDINIFDGVNKINMNDQWLKTNKNLSEDDLKLDLFIEDENYKDKLKMNISKIKEYISTMTGGYSSLESLGIELEYIKKTTNGNRKYLSTSLFDRGSNSENKNINHYSLCLFLAFTLYKKYLPDYNFALYIDKSISESVNDNVKTVIEHLKKENNIDIILVTQKLDDVSLIDKTNKNTIGLYGAFYRFFIYLNPDVETIIMIDADNFPTERFCDYVKDFELTAKNETIGIFKPLYYMRKNVNDDCIPQILAGMHCLKKEKNTIMNPKIFVLIYEYISKQYDKFKNEFYDYCDSNVKIKYNTPFQFGFEENAFTNIVMPFFLKKNIIVYPLFFDFGKGFNFYYNEIIVSLKPHIADMINKTLSLNINTSKYLTYCLPDNSFNLYIGIIFTGYIYKCLKNNVDIFIDAIKKEHIEKLMSISGFYHIYPAFNIQMNIYQINKYIDDLYNGDIDNIRIKYDKLPISAYKEFGIDSYNFYKNTVDEGKIPASILPFLKEGYEGYKNGTYKEKYLKYKNKYLKLKNKNSL